jgi:hypothetical protein
VFDLGPAGYDANAQLALVRIIFVKGLPICCFSMDARKDERFAANTAGLLIGAGS